MHQLNFIKEIEKKKKILKIVHKNLLVPFYPHKAINENNILICNSLKLLPKIFYYQYEWYFKTFI